QVLLDSSADQFRAAARESSRRAAVAVKTVLISGHFDERRIVIRAAADFDDGDIFDFRLRHSACRAINCRLRVLFLLRRLGLSSRAAEKAGDCGSASEHRPLQQGAPIRGFASRFAPKLTTRFFVVHACLALMQGGLYPQNIMVGGRTMRMV